MTDMASRPYYAAPPQNLGLIARWRSKGGFLGGLASILIMLSKLKGLLLLLKFAFIGKMIIAFGSAIVSIWVMSSAFGWLFAAGLMAIIVIHECGHAFAAWRLGHKINGMIFLPFMGGVVSTAGGKDITENAYIGIMGPVFGTVACTAIGIYGFVTDSQLWLSLAALGFIIHLFNLLPTVPLDGGWIVPMMSPKLLAVGMVLLFVMAFHFHITNPIIYILALLSIPRVISGWKADPATQPYYRAKVKQRVLYTIGYFTMAAYLAGCWFLLAHAMAVA
jgi:Zn-dependent protease